MLVLALVAGACQREARELHEREAITVKTSKIETPWEPTPFPPDLHG
ncbi:hypothetical protein PQJ75_06185 [Rhodoplanes sp. TEM]|nr:hypothetical protein [Rhodoplanes sp. TEM]MDQ0354760.1 hypothetical protein [Rhodoplanes tepidamans]